MDPASEFEFFLAQKLGKTVAQMLREMSHKEFIDWCTYYSRKAQREELEQLKAKR